MAETPAPIFLIGGGPATRARKGPDPVLQAVILRSGIQRPTIAYVGAASGDNDEFRIRNIGRLQEAGAGEVTLAPVCSLGTDEKKVKGILEVSDLVFVSGGDVDAGMRFLEEKKMVDFLRRLYLSGKPFFGVSAGSIMLAQKWVRWRDPDDDRSAELFPCLGFAPILCDTHGEDDGWQELQALLRLSSTGTIGYGISSGAAVVVEPCGDVYALGGEVARFAMRTGRVVRIKSLFPGTPPSSLSL